MLRDIDAHESTSTQFASVRGFHASHLPVAFAYGGPAQFRCRHCYQLASMIATRCIRHSCESNSSAAFNSFNEYLHKISAGGTSCVLLKMGFELQGDR